MVKQILSKAQHGFDWFDISNPTVEDFAELKNQYSLNDASIKDCLETGHLPKIEEFESYHFLIIRFIAENFPENSDHLIEVTNRISIFYDEDFVITAHRYDIPVLQELIDMDKGNKRFKSSKSLINTLVSLSIKSFENLVVNSLATKLDLYEEIVFLHNRRKPLLRKVYYLKRQIDLIRIILTFYKDIVEYCHMPEYQNMYGQVLRELDSGGNTLYRNVGENRAQLRSVYFNIECNDADEIRGTLTIISVFFMPLTFSVGLYGMSLQHMP